MEKAKRWKNSSDTIAITAAGTSDTVATVRVMDGASRLWFQATNSAHKVLDKFYTWVQPYSDATFHKIATTASDYTTRIQVPILACDQDMTSLAKSTAGLVWMDVKGLYSVKFTASAATGSDTTVDYKWQVR